jgi:hypothetical protein
MHPRVLEVYLDGTLARAMGAGLAESLDHVAGAAAAFASVAVNPAGAARHARQTASLVARLPAALDRRGSSAGL